jgi:hypothetical protein
VTWRREFTTTRRISGAERTMTQEITELDAPTTWAARGIDGPIRPHATVTVEPLDGAFDQGRTGKHGNRY